MGIPYQDADAPPAEKPPEIPEWAVLLDAPDFTTLIGKKTATGVSRQYQVKVQSALKLGLQLRLGAPEGKGLPDAAAILAYGPDFALRAGELADADEGFRKALDLLTAPDNPVLLFALAALPFAAQLLRNHEQQVTAIPGNIRRNRAMSREQRKAARAAQPRAEIRIPGIKRKLRIPFRLRMPSGFFRAQTHEPAFLVHRVFSNTDVQAALHKNFGLKVTPNGAHPDA